MRRLAFFAVLALVAAPSAAPRPGARAVSPTALRAFLLRADEPVKADHTYAEMPAFTWQPVAGASRYELELADNSSFNDTSILYSSSDLQAPVASIQMQMPWMTGDPYALWVHVRAIVKGQPTEWSKPFGFNTGWQNVPEQEPAPTGLIRWTPVEGATSYQVWFTNIGRVFPTLTNVADEREFWTLHPSVGATVRWRVRAVRYTSTQSLPTGIELSQYGPWSEPFTTLSNTTIKSGPLKGGRTISDVTSDGPHALMPAFYWTGTDGSTPAAIGNQLWRVYVYSDRRCINQVMVGSITGEPAWAPRATQALALPSDSDTLAKDEQNGTILKPGSEGATYMADLSAVTASENAGGSASTPSASSSSGNATQTGTSSAGSIELPDSGWPAGRYWWTVVPVNIVDIPPDPSSSSSSSSSSSGGAQSDAIEYHDAELPQDACATGRVWPFAIRSAPVTAAAAAKPFASGLVSSRLVASADRAPNFVELPLVTWQPAIGAQSYEIQLSRHPYPWVAVKNLTSVVTSAVLPLAKSDHGTWYYRVRGVNPNLPSGAQKMTWSSPVAISITGNRISVLSG